MKLDWKWILGIVLIVILLLGMPFVRQFVMPNGGYETMMRGYSYVDHMPMMGYGYGMHSYGMFFMWLIPLGNIVLISLGIVWLVKQLTSRPS